MKRRFFQFISILCTAVLCCTAMTAPVFAVGTADEAPPCTEITVKQSEIEQKGTFKAIQAALNAARYSATNDNRYKIIVEPGTYDLRSALHIYSNTTLSLYNVTLKRNPQAIANIIRIGDDTAADKGETGYDANSNIVLEGGTLDGGATNNTMVKVTHARNFRMAGVMLCNLKNAHMMEIAAVDGFTVRNCTFRDQLLDVNGVGYEAIQLDICKVGHIVGARSEALNMRNVHIEGCYFVNVPRGVGTHTQILNHPFDGIVITNNTFADITSVAIQGENWKNVQITNNRIKNTPRAIAYYSVLGGNSCGFKASVLAKEGGTYTDISDSYQTPFNANILIADNEITDSGKVKDVYAPYEPVAVSLFGKTLTAAGKTFSDGAGNYPKGSYYVTGVTIRNNIIQAAGKGIYLEQVRNTTVSGNQIACTANALSNKIGNPITALDASLNRIEGNTITASPDNGIELARTSVGAIQNNVISGVPLDGILLEAESKVTKGLSGNTISKASRYGLNIRPKCAGGTIADNIIFGCTKGGICQEKTSTGSLKNNYFAITDMATLSLNTQSATLGNGEKLTLVPSYTPVNVLTQFSWASADTTVASVNSKGVVTAHGFGETDITVTAAGGKTASAHIKVMPAPRSVKLNANMLIIGEGESFDLDSKLPEGTVSHSIAYSSNNEKTVTVQKDTGVLKGVFPGSATILCNTYNGKHAACNVIVKPAPNDLWFDKRELALGAGETTRLSLQLPDGTAANRIEWKSDHPAVLTVSDNGTLTAVAPGEATVTATAFNGAKAICRVTVQDEPSAVRFAQSAYTLTAGETDVPALEFPAGSTSYHCQFQSSDPDICRVDKATGALTAKKPGVVTLTVKTYNRVFATCTVTVQAAPPAELFW